MTTLSQRDQKVVWHPFTQHRLAPQALPIARGKGAYLYDTEGKAYLDLISSWLVNIHGHAHPQIAQAIYDQAQQLEHVIFAGFTHEPGVAVAEKLLALLPSGFSKVFYSDNGATSVEVALKMAYQYWRNRGEPQHRRFLAFQDGYHGDTFGAMAVGRSCNFYDHFVDLMFEVDHAPFPGTWLGDPDVEKKENAALNWIEHYFQQYSTQLAAVIIEPLIQATGGANICRPEFLRALERLARQYQVLIIYDEVMTGFGRTGALFACEKAGTRPDLICLSKGITGGFLPLAVTICQENIFEAFLHQDINYALIHGHSYTANPLACAAALASLTLLEEPATQAQIRMIEETHQKNFQALVELPYVEKLRFCGTMAAFNAAIHTPYGSPLSYQWRQAFLDRGLLVRPLGNTVYLLPPYCISQDDLNRAYIQIKEVIEIIYQENKYENSYR